MNALTTAFQYVIPLFLIFTIASDRKNKEKGDNILKRGS